MIEINKLKHVTMYLEITMRQSVRILIYDDVSYVDDVESVEPVAAFLCLSCSFSIRQEFTKRHMFKLKVRT